MSQPPPYAPPQGNPPQDKSGYPPPGPYPNQPQQAQPIQPGYPQGQYPPPQGQYPPPQQYPQPGYQQAAPGYAQNTTTVITTQPAVVTAVAVHFHEFPVALTCPSCKAQVVTSVHYDVGTFAWLLFFLMCFFGFWICCFIPFCVDSCKDAIHHCPNCSVQLGVYRRM